MRCKSCWRQAEKAAIHNQRRVQTIYKLTECTHHAKPIRKAPREISISFTANLTPLHDLFPAGVIR